MEAIAFCCNGLLGYTARRFQGRAKQFLLLPLIVSTSFFLIAGIDSPWAGVTLVHPQNLESVLAFFDLPRTSPIPILKAGLRIGRGASHV
jgi:hypothetical protein